MSNTFGESIRVTVFGQSHAPAIGVVMDNLPHGVVLDLSAIESMLERRAPGRSDISTKRREPDKPRVISGLNERGATCGAPLCVVIDNADTRSADYEAFRDTPRPAHADYPASVRYDGHNDLRGGGQFSGRLTAPLCVAGAICGQVLRGYGVSVAARIVSIDGVCDEPKYVDDIDEDALANLRVQPLPTLSPERAELMTQEIKNAQRLGDSVGGVIEVWARGVPCGIGGGMFSGLDTKIAGMLFSVPGVRGVEFGAGEGSGFGAAAIRGSQHNDEYYYNEGTVATRTNRHGGVIGGISTGSPIVARVAVKPTPTIAQPQNTVNLRTLSDATLEARGRHDPCIVPRAVPVVESAVMIAILDAWVGWGGRGR